MQIAFFGLKKGVVGGMGKWEIEREGEISCWNICAIQQQTNSPTCTL